VWRRVNRPFSHDQHPIARPKPRYLDLRARYIADEMQQAVLIDRLRPVRLTVAAHVDRDSMESSRR
jgi:hypothetical protein